jgi:hypothetical protein
MFLFRIEINYSGNKAHTSGVGGSADDKRQECRHEFCINWDSSVGIATGYWLDDPGSISGRGKFCLFSMASRPDLGPNQPPIQWVLRSFPRG